MWTLRQAGEVQVIAPDERLAWPAMVGLGGQHVLAMFGATAVVPVLTGFPVSTTLLFSGIGTLLFVLITGNRVPSYTGSSFAFIAPVLAAKADGGVPAALGGILVAGVTLALLGLLIDRAGYRVVEFLLPPVVTGAIISAIPIGVLGGAVTVLFGLIAVLGARNWIEARVDFREPVNLATAGVALIVGAGNYTLHWGDYEFAGIALGTLAAVLTYQIMRPIAPAAAPRAGAPSPPAPGARSAARS